MIHKVVYKIRIIDIRPLRVTQVQEYHWVPNFTVFCPSPLTQRYYYYYSNIRVRLTLGALCLKRILQRTDRQVVRNEQVFMIIDFVGCTVPSLVSYSAQDKEPLYQLLFHITTRYRCSFESYVYISGPQDLGVEDVKR